MKILIIRLSSIGDIVVTTPIIRAVKQQIPNCELHFLIRDNHVHVLESNPYIDVMHHYTRDSEEYMAALYEQNFDYVIDLHKNFRTKKILRKLKRPYITYDKLNIKKWILVNFRIDLMPDCHLADRYFEAVKSLGIVNDFQGLDFPIPAEKAYPIMEQFPQLSNGYFTVAVGSLHKTKQIPPSLLLEIIPQLKRPVVLLGGNDVADIAEELTAALPTQIINLCAKCSLLGSASVMEQSIAVITGDTGLMHIAAALKMNIISLWGNTTHCMGMYPYMPTCQQKSIEFENKKLWCHPCSKLGYKKCPRNHHKCMMTLPADKIAHAMNQLITNQD